MITWSVKGVRNVHNVESYQIQKKTIETTMAGMEERERKSFIRTLEERIDNDTSHDVIYEGTVISDKDINFPGVPPDLWKEMKNHNTEYKREGDYYHIMDDNVCRDMYRQKMKNNSTWRRPNKHYVSGALYKNVEDRFYVVQMKQPEKVTYMDGGKKKSFHRVHKYRIRVKEDDIQNEKERLSLKYRYVDFAHTPLHQVSQKHRFGLGKELYNNANQHKIESNNCRKGDSMGAMMVMGTRMYAKKLVRYAQTNNKWKKLEETSDRFFKKYGFTHWVQWQRTLMEKIGAHKNNMVGSGSSFPWCSMTTTSVNYGNETHIDDSDAGQAITIWHETNPPRPESKKVNVKNWYFLFPDLKILVDGKWRTGVAIPLQHGTIISWDANVYRHCTAAPLIEKTREGDDKTVACGTFFGIAKKVANYCIEEKQNKKRKNY